MSGNILCAPVVDIDHSMMRSVGTTKETLLAVRGVSARGLLRGHISALRPANSSCILLYHALMLALILRNSPWAASQFPMLRLMEM